MLNQGLFKNSFRHLSPMYFLYILQCQDKSLYTGITNNLERRFLEHKNKK
ncbi:MAG: hypothetical protein UW89_C0020G0015, partial [Parcubacteria group bacterium GW2011_GWB1_45_10]